DVDAEAGALGEAVGEVHRARLHELVREVALAGQEPHGDELGLVGQQALDAGVGDGAEVAVQLDLRRTPDGQVQVGDSGRQIEHRLEQRIEIEIGHQRLRERGSYHFWFILPDLGR